MGMAMITPVSDDDKIVPRTRKFGSPNQPRANKQQQTERGLHVERFWLAEGRCASEAALDTEIEALAEFSASFFEERLASQSSSRKLRTQVIRRKPQEPKNHCSQPNDRADFAGSPPPGHLVGGVD